MDVHLEQYIARITTKEEEIQRSIATIKSILLENDVLSVAAYNSLKPFLRHLEQILLQHFQWQKSKFWEILFDSFQDPHSQKTIKYLESSLQEIKVAMLKFFDAHPGTMGDTHRQSFISDFSSFACDLTGFVKDEKKYLIPLLKGMNIEI